MLRQLIDFWRARTPRERLLLRGAGILIFGILLPLTAYQGALRFRADAAASLANARAVQADVRRLAAQAGPQASDDVTSDGTLRGMTFALAQANGLTVARIEPTGPDRISIALEPADSLKVYRWMDAVSRRGAAVERTVLRRAGQGDQVIGEFEIVMAARR